MSAPIPPRAPNPAWRDALAEDRRVFGGQVRLPAETTPSEGGWRTAMWGATVSVILAVVLWYVNRNGYMVQGESAIEHVQKPTTSTERGWFVVVQDIKSSKHAMDLINEMQSRVHAGDAYYGLSLAADRPTITANKDQVQHLMRVQVARGKLTPVDLTEIVVSSSDTSWFSLARHVVLSHVGTLWKDDEDSEILVTVVLRASVMDNVRDNVGIFQHIMESAMRSDNFDMVVADPGLTTPCPQGNVHVLQNNCGRGILKRGSLVVGSWVNSTPTVIMAPMRVWREEETTWRTVVWAPNDNEYVS
jgi:hypothetical protein